MCFCTTETALSVTYLPVQRPARTRTAVEASNHGGTGQLHNLKDDPAELNDLYGSPELAEVQRSLLEDLLTWSLRVQDPLPLPRSRYILKRHPRNYWTDAT